MEMKKDYVWPIEEEKIVENFLNSGVNLMQEKFGALSQDSDNIYSRICIGNSLISLEPYRGCPLKCKYCMANNDVRSLDLEKYNGKDFDSIIVRKPEKIVSTSELVDAMVRHPVFIPDKSIIGICTGSSEFFLPELSDDIWFGMVRLIELGYKNPIWIVVKSFLDINNKEKWIERFDFLDKNGVKVILSISDIGAPKDIEPYQVDRFKIFDFLKNTNVIISHHMRPIIPGDYFTDELIDDLLDKSLNIVKSVCVGGLRIDPGMEIFWDNEITKQYNSITGNQDKIFDQKILKKVEEKVKLRKQTIPIFDKTSMMISYHLGISDFNLYRYRKNLEGAFLRVNLSIIKNAEQKHSKNIIKLLKEVAVKISLDNVEFSMEKDKIYVSRKLLYQEERSLIHAIGHFEIFE